MSRSVLSGGFRTPVAVAAILVVVATVLTPSAAWAVPTVHEISARWAGAPAPTDAPYGVTRTAEFRVNTNDAQDPYANEIVSNVRATLTVTNGVFVSVPQVCLTRDVTPASAITANGTQLLCNLGTVEEGTAAIVQAPVKATGATGSQLSVSGTATSDTAVATAGPASTAPLPITGTRGMDLVISAPNEHYQQVVVPSRFGGNRQTVVVDYGVSMTAGSIPGPSTYSFGLDLAVSVAGQLPGLQWEGCAPVDDTAQATGIPYSTPSRTNRTNAPTCAITGSGTSYTVTLSGLDYSLQNVPTLDSLGNTIPSTTNFIAAGKLVFSYTTPITQSTGVSFSATPTPFTFVDGVTQAETNPGNNTSGTTVVLPGSFAISWGGGPLAGRSAWDANAFAAPGSAEGARFPLPGAGSSTNPGPSSPSQFPIASSADSTAWTTYAGPGGADLAGLCSMVQNPAAFQPTQASYFAVDGAQVSNIRTAHLWYRTDALDTKTETCGQPVGVASSPWIPAPVPAECTTRTAHISPVYSDGICIADLPAGVTAVKMTWDPAVDTQMHHTLQVWGHVPDTAPIGAESWTVGAFNASYDTSSVFGAQWPNQNNWINISTNPSVLANIPGSTYGPNTNGQRDAMRIQGPNGVITKSTPDTTAQPGLPVTYTLTAEAQLAIASPPAQTFTVSDTLPAGMELVPGTANPTPAVSTDGAGRQVLAFTFTNVPANTPQPISYQARIPSGTAVAPGTVLTNVAQIDVPGDQRPAAGRQASASVTVPSNAATTLGKATEDNVLSFFGDESAWVLTINSQDPVASSYTDTIDILPALGDGRGTTIDGDYTITGVTAPAGSTVYYTTAPLSSLSSDPRTASNGTAPGSVSGNTVGWSTTAVANPTAIRVIGPALAPGATQTIRIGFETPSATSCESPAATDNKPGQILVNSATTIAQHTELPMQSSSTTTIGSCYAVNLKKFVQDADGQWHDANNTADFPTFRVGDTVRYRVVAENVGQGTVTGLEITDDLQPELGSFVIDSLARGETETREYEVVIDGGGAVVNTACATADAPSDGPAPVIPCDPAGIEVVNYTTAKTSTPGTGSAVRPGDTITYTVTVTQQGTVPAAAEFSDTLAEVLDDAVYNGDITASVGEVTYTDGVIDWSGTVPVGGVATVTYSVTVKDSSALAADGDYAIGNVVTSAGCVDAASCGTEHEVGDFRVVKTSDPADGENVQVGDRIEYTVTVTQVGEAGYEDASLVDDLTAVLDDATWDGFIGSPAGATFEAPTLAWTGDLAVGQTVTLRYAVVVTAAGDGRLDNVVTSDGCWSAEDCTTGQPTGSYTVVKTSDPADGSDVEPGDTVTYTVTVAQRGQGAVEGAEFRDDLSGVLDDARWVGDLLATSGTATIANGTVAWRGDLAVGQTATITYSVLVGDEGDLALRNVVTSAGCVTLDDCRTEHAIGTYRTVKTSTPASGSDIAPGDVIEYTVTVSQDGPGAVGNASFIDDLSGVLDEADWGGDLAVTAGDAEFTGDAVTWNGPLAVGDVVTVTYSATFVGGDDNRITNVVTSDGCALVADCVTTHPGGTYIVEKAADTADGTSVAEGDSITYTVTVTQVGPAPVDASLSDDLSAVLDDATWNGDLVASQGDASYAGGILSWSDTLQPGDVVTLTYSVTVTGAGDTRLANVVTSDGCVTAESCETDHVTGDYTVVKTAAPSSPTAQVGDVIDYTITITQSGAGAVRATLSDALTDVLDDATWNGDLAVSSGTGVFTGTGITWTGQLEPGAVVTLTYSVTTTALGDGEILNTVTSPGCATAADCSVRYETGRYEVTKTADPATGASVAAGDTVEYTVTVTHRGLADVPASFRDDLTAVLDDAVFADDLQATAGTAAFTEPTIEWSGILSQGDEVTVTYSVRVTAAGDGTLTNVVTSDGCAADCTTTHLAGRYTVSKTADPVPGSTVQVGDTIAYSLEIRQFGAAPLAGVTVTDDLGDVLDDAQWDDTAEATSGAVSRTGEILTWTGDLTLGQAVTVTYSVTVTGAGDMTLVNRVTPDDAGSCVPAPDQNPDCTTTHTTGRFEYSKTADPAHGSDVAEGDVIGYTVTIAQVGPGAVSGATVTDDLSDVIDDAVYNDDAAADSGSTAYVAPALTWTGDLAVGQAVQLTYSVTVGGEGDTTLANVVSSPSEAGSCVPAPDGTADCRTVHKTGGYVFAKTADPASGTRVAEGRTVTYTLTVTQRGEGVVRDAIVTDDLTAVLDDASWNGDATASAGAVEKVADTLTWMGDLEVGQTVAITYSVTVGGDGDGTLLNVVSSPDPRSVCDPAGACTTTHGIVPASAVAVTGGTIAGGVVVAALVLLLAGGALLIVRRRRTRA